jgi:penicillin-insensitive murein endopeptidase
MVGRWLGLALFSTILLDPGQAGAHGRAVSPPAQRSRSGGGESVKPRSIGSPTEGRLEGAKALEPSKDVRLRNKHARWGLPRLVGLIARSAKKLAHRFDGATLLVGDLSRRDGGDIAGHRSHESGRDADVAFLFVDRHGKSVQPAEFLTVNREGHAVENQAWRFDDARNWALVESWVTDPGARVEHIFVADWLRTRLLRYARDKGAYLPVLHRAALAMKQPSHGLEHDDHFHVRIACPPGQRKTCIAQPKPQQEGVKRASVHHPHARGKTTARALVKRRKQGETTRQ